MGTQILDLNPKVSRRNIRPEPEQIGALETLRGLGAVIVLICHLAAFFFPAAFSNSSAAPRFPLETWLRGFPGSLLISGRFAVSLFFVLSGVVLSLRYLGPKAAPEADLAGAAVKRLFRLLPMVTFAALTTLVLGRAGLLFHLQFAQEPELAWLSTLKEWQKPLYELMRQAWYRPITEASALAPPLYTIGVEIQGSFLIFALLFLMRHVQRPRWILGFTLLVFHAQSLAGFVAGLMLAEAFQNSARFRHWASRVWIAIPTLLVGLWLGSQQLEGPGSLENSVGGPFLRPIHFGLYGWQMIGAILVLAVILGNKTLLRYLDFQVGRWLGSISYGLYAIHFTVLSSLGCWIVQRTPEGNQDWTTLLTAAVISGLASIAAGWALRGLIDRPSQRLASWAGRFFTLPRG